MLIFNKKNSSLLNMAYRFQVFFVSSLIQITFKDQTLQFSQQNRLSLPINMKHFREAIMLDPNALEQICLFRLFFVLSLRLLLYNVISKM